MPTKDTIERAIEYFEANLLDGDKIDDCGQCTLAVDKDFIEVLRGTIKHAIRTQRQEMIAELKGMDGSILRDKPDVLMDEKPFPDEHSRDLAASVLAFAKVTDNNWRSKIDTLIKKLEE